MQAFPVINDPSSPDQRASQPSHDELARLAALFDGSVPKQPRKEKREPPLQLNFRRTLRQMDMRRMCFLRYGTEQP